MDDRKRPATHDHDDSTPPRKKQATLVNGNTKSHVDADMPWKDDLEKFQKEAIWRQMQEYKRDRTSLEAQLKTAQKERQYHDEHITILDAWFSQLLEDIRVLIGDQNTKASFVPFPAAVLCSNPETFETHLKSRSSQISAALSKVFALSQPATELSEIQARISELLITEKEHIIQLEKNRREQERLEERLEDATVRYMVAEKKLDRSKSAAVAKLEKQAITGGRSESGSGLGGDIDASAGSQKDAGPSAGELAGTELARKEAVALSTKRKEQIDSLAAENEKLTAELQASQNRLNSLSDEDYSKSDLFKQLKTQYEEVVKRINDLEATNIQLREEAERLHAERTAYKMQVEQESAHAISESEKLLAQAETDLTRIRLSRDELTADVAMRKAAQNQERAAIDQVRELTSAKDDRISALEAEVARLQTQTGQITAPASPQASLDGLSPDEMQTRYANLEKQHHLLNTELQSMASAFSKTNKAASQKVANLSSLEEKIQRLTAEKSKADQKYFATMKVKETREQEVRTLRAQNAKSSEMVSSLKESEAASRGLQVVSDKQIAEGKESILNISAKLRLEQQALNERNVKIDGLQSQIEDYKKQLAAKNDLNSAKSSATRDAEVLVEGLKVRLEETEKNLEIWKARGSGNQSTEFEQLRHLALCTVCRSNFKDTALKTCGHVFCKDCVDERTASRSRKCPNCNRSFGTGDVMRVTL